MRTIVKFLLSVIIEFFLKLFHHIFGFKIAVLLFFENQSLGLIYFLKGFLIKLIGFLGYVLKNLKFMLTCIWFFCAFFISAFGWLCYAEASINQNSTGQLLFLTSIVTVLLYQKTIGKASYAPLTLPESKAKLVTVNELKKAAAEAGLAPVTQGSEIANPQVTNVIPSYLYYTEVVPVKPPFSIVAASDAKHEYPGHILNYFYGIPVAQEMQPKGSLQYIKAKDLQDLLVAQSEFFEKYETSQFGPSFYSAIRSALHQINNEISEKPTKSQFADIVEDQFCKHQSPEMHFPSNFLIDVYDDFCVSKGPNFPEIPQHYVDIINQTGNLRVPVVEGGLTVLLVAIMYFYLELAQDIRKVYVKDICRAGLRDDKLPITYWSSSFNVDRASWLDRDYNHCGYKFERNYRSSLVSFFASILRQDFGAHGRNYSPRSLLSLITKAILENGDFACRTPAISLNNTSDEACAFYNGHYYYLKMLRYDQIMLNVDGSIALYVAATKEQGHMLNVPEGTQLVAYYPKGAWRYEMTTRDQAHPALPMLKIVTDSNQCKIMQLQTAEQYKNSRDYGKLILGWFSRTRG